MTDDKVPVDYVLLKINETFKVSDISNTIETAKDLTKAEEIHKKKHFDRVPIANNGTFLIYYDFNFDRETNIEPKDIMSSCTGIIETFSYLSQEDFYFINEGNKITRIVHYSDLNNLLILTGLFPQIAYCEKAIRDYVRKEYSNAYSQKDIVNFLEDINKKIKGVKMNLERSKKEFCRKVEKMIETDFFDELYFNDELILFREIYSSKLQGTQVEGFRNFINLSDKKIAHYNKLRTNIMHSKPQIINQKSDIKKWLDFLQTCQNIIMAINGDKMMFR